jgi:hypothetical protein
VYKVCATATAFCAATNQPHQGRWRGTLVAVKKLHDFDPSDPDAVNEFNREVSMMQELGNHPKVSGDTTFPIWCQLTHSQ